MRVFVPAIAGLAAACHAADTTRYPAKDVSEEALCRHTDSPHIDNLAKLDERSAEDIRLAWSSFIVAFLSYGALAVKNMHQNCGDFPSLSGINARVKRIKMFSSQNRNISFVPHRPNRWPLHARCMSQEQPACVTSGEATSGLAPIVAKFDQGDSHAGPPWWAVALVRFDPSA